MFSYSVPTPGRPLIATCSLPAFSAIYLLLLNSRISHRGFPAIYGLAALVFYHPAACAARGRIFPAPARGIPHHGAKHGPKPPCNSGS
jgi:hypothetical protein